MLDDVDTTKKFPAPRPVVTLSYAQTLDERLATSTGSSQWINARESLRFSHELRAKAALHQRGIGSVQVEGGAGVITVLLQARLLDRLVVCIAPKILGAGTETVGDLRIRELARALLMTDTSVTRYGVDLILDGRIEYPGTPPKTITRKERVGCVTV